MTLNYDQFTCGQCHVCQLKAAMERQRESLQDYADTNIADRAEIARLRAEVAEWSEDYAKTYGELCSLRAEVKHEQEDKAALEEVNRVLKAEVERLRAALEQMVEAAPSAEEYDMRDAVEAAKTVLRYSGEVK